ncbi:MAG: pyridoxal-phosphate dependent enzyme [Thermoprotei archaeon]|nr:pyridoxal-phosphate dependent enzyme [Thermoprotei archaeon]
MLWSLYCPRCGFSGGLESYYPWCPRCGGPLEVSGDLPSFPRVLGEGRTPVVFESFYGGIVGFKLEYLNPSGSFKDRGVSYSLQLARSLGYKCAVVDSSGNTAMSLAAFALRLGLEPIVVVPKTAGAPKVSLLRALGARVLMAESRVEASKMAVAWSGECFHVSHLASPIFLEGMKSLGLEIAEHYRSPTVIAPVSSGSLILGVYRGLKEAGAKPRLVAVQASEASPLARVLGVLASVGGDKSSLADALVIREPPRLEEIARAVMETGGGVVRVGDEAIRSALGELLSMGFIVEPSSAVVWAAFNALAGKLEDKDVVLILTGSGLKYSRELENIIGAPP